VYVMRGQHICGCSAPHARGRACACNADGTVARAARSVRAPMPGGLRGIMITWRGGLRGLRPEACGSGRLAREMGRACSRGRVAGSGACGLPRDHDAQGARRGDSEAWPAGHVSCRRASGRPKPWQVVGLIRPETPCQDALVLITADRRSGCTVRDVDSDGDTARLARARGTDVAEGDSDWRLGKHKLGPRGRTGRQLADGGVCGGGHAGGR
jgi:hypothetical protein